MAKSYANKFNPEGRATRYRNQGYSGEDLYGEKKRAESYSKWVNRGSPSSKDQESTQIGSVSSSWLDTLGYSTNTNEAVATFKGINATFYYQISYETFLNWLNSPSKGKWLHDHPGIMRNYTLKGGGTRSTYESRIKGLYKTRSDKRTGSDGSALGKARVRAYLEKYR